MLRVLCVLVACSGVAWADPDFNQICKNPPELEKQCRGGDGDACNWAAHCFWRGINTPRDQIKTQELSIKGCELGNAERCWGAGIVLTNGDGPVPKDVPRAIPLNQKGCDLKNKFACYNLALNFEETKQPARAREAMKRACELENWDACGSLSWWLDAGINGPADWPLAAKYAQKGCDGKSGVACANLGFFYDAGRGVPSNRPLALGHYMEACELGHTNGCRFAGNMFRNGGGGRFDLGVALSFYLAACQKGDKDACTAQSQLASQVAPRPVPASQGFLIGSRPAVTGTPPEPDWNLVCRNPADAEGRCRNGDAEACTVSGCFYLGTGVAKDVKRSFDLAERGCGIGNLGRCAGAGYLLTYGDGVPKDVKRAAAFNQKACDGGYGNSCFWLYLDKNEMKDLPGAARALEKSCELGYPVGCTALSHGVETGYGGLRVDPARAARLAERACAAKEGTGCSNLGAYYESGKGVQLDKPAALNSYLQGCELGAGLPCRFAGNMFRYGAAGRVHLGVALSLYSHSCAMGDADGCRVRDELLQQKVAPALPPSTLYPAPPAPVRAELPDSTPQIEQWIAGCNRDDAISCYEAAHALDEGRTARRNPARSVSLSKRGCELGGRHACSILGSHYMNGDGVAQSTKLAVDAYRTGCACGDRHACRQLEPYGGMIATVSCPQPAASQPVQPPPSAGCDEQDYQECKERCEQGDAESCLWVGRQLLRGRAGAPKDPARGMAKLELACKGGIQDACKDLDYERTHQKKR